METLLFGVAYYDEYMPYDRIKEDMDMIKRSGMNVIRIGESTWSTWEPQDGVFDFTHLDRMLDAAQEVGIWVIVGTPTYAIPTWLVRKHPDVLAITKNGPGLYGHRQNMDITNPHYLFYGKRVITKMMEHVKGRKHIIGFQIDNETKSYDTSSAAVQKMFVDYLKEKFQDINELNHAFGLDYWSNRINTWEDFPDIRGTINGSLGGEFKKFQRLLVTRFFQWQADIIKPYLTKKQFLTHNFDYGWRDYSFGLQPEVNQQEAAKCMDLTGVDIYHPSQDNLTGAEIAFGGAIGRAIKKSNYLVLETQAQGNKSWLPYPNQLRLQAFSHLASGANSIMYWHWHSIHNSFETYWKGVLSHDLTENYIYREAKTIGDEFNRLGDKLVNLTKQCDAAIMINNESLMGMEWFPISKTLSYNDILRWIFDAFYRMNIECDIIYDTETNLEKYKVIAVPGLYSAQEEVLNRLEEYTAKGGHLLTTFKSAFSNEYLKVYSDQQPHILHKCCGMYYQHFTVPNHTGLCSSVFPVSPELTVTDWMELLVPTQGTVWACYNHPHWGTYAAITHNKYMEGSATYIGCYFDSDCLESLIKHLWKELNLSLPDQNFPLIKKSGINAYNKQLDYYFNYSENPSSFLWEKKEGLELITNTSVEKGSRLFVMPWNFVIVESDFAG